MSTHDCVQYLKSVINLKNERILALMDENHRLKNGDPEEDDNERGQINPFNIGMIPEVMAPNMLGNQENREALIKECFSGHDL
jgi:hypothetical protein